MKNNEICPQCTHALRKEADGYKCDNCGGQFELLPTPEESRLLEEHAHKRMREEWLKHQKEWSKSLGQIAYEEWARIVHPNAETPWEQVGMQVGWGNIAQACVIETQRQHQLEMGYYPSMLEKSEEEVSNLREIIKELADFIDTDSGSGFGTTAMEYSEFYDKARELRKKARGLIQ